MELIFNDDNLMKRLNVTHKMWKAIRKFNGAFYRSWLYARHGSGLSKQDFDSCLKMLEVTNCITIVVGEKGGEIITAKEVSKAALYSPEEIIGHAMQCPPITKDSLAGVTE